MLILITAGRSASQRAPSQVVAQCLLVLCVQIPDAAPQLTKVLAGLRHTFVVADYTLPDCPLVFASEG